MALNTFLLYYERNVVFLYLIYCYYHDYIFGFKRVNSKSLITTAIVIATILPPFSRFFIRKWDFSPNLNKSWTTVRLHLIEQNMLTLPEHFSLSHILNWIMLITFCLYCFIVWCLSSHPFSFFIKQNIFFDLWFLTSLLSSWFYFLVIYIIFHN